MAGVLTAAVASTFGANADPYFEYTTLLLPGNGTNGAQNNTFLDSSTNNFTITRNGNTTQGTFSPYGGGWSNYFDGNGDSLSYTGGSSLNFGTGDFTIETWAYLTNTGTFSAFLRPDETGTFPEWGYDFSTGQLKFQARNAAIVDTTTAMPTNQWVHVAVSRSGTSLRQFINGTQVGSTTTNSTNFGSTTGAIRIGGSSFSASHSVNGYLSNFRVVVGTALYTTTFTPPAAPLTAISGTSLLTCQSNRFIDNSSNNFTITRNGDTRVVAFSPFNPSSSWSAATYGGSGYFDGSGDYLSVADNAAFTATGDFCLEAWVYLNSLPADYGLVVFGNGVGPGGEGYGIRGSSATAVFSTTTGNITSASQFSTGRWIHVALLRSGTGTNNVAAYVNGTRIGTQSSTTTFDPPGGVVGRYYTGTDNFYLNGYVSDARLVVGSAVYQTGGATPPATITVPTAPLTAITNTTLLLNFTNAGIYDATSKNDLETVGNAQISNTTAKWGSTSIKFDGTGDYLIMPPSPVLEFGGGDFTIEFWFYSNSISTYQTLIERRSSVTVGGLVISIYLSAVAFNVGDANTSGWEVNIGGSSLSSSTWYHVACTRSGSSWKMFVNGTQQGSTATWSGTPAFETSALRIAGDASGANSLNGYMQDIRITKGYARYTANFTPPTAPFPTL